MPDMVSLIIDGIPVQVASGETILQAAEKSGIQIPTLCFMEGLADLESCGVCVVEVEGNPNLLPSCVSRCLPDMKIRTDSEKVRKARKLALELLLSDHLGDCQAPCELACPAEIDIPEFIRQIRYNHPDKALRVILEKIAFPGVLGRICPKFCEGVCRRGEYDEPVSICSLKRFPADIVPQDIKQQQHSAVVRSGKKVAILGSGVVGLTAAYYLTLAGHECIVFEAAPRPGGAMRNIIPEFRLPAQVIDDEIADIQSLGVKIHCNQALGKDVFLDDLRNEYDAILLAIGANGEKHPTFSGSDLGQSCFNFLEQVAYGACTSVEKNVVIIGSGPTSLDSARTCLRLGAEEVTMIIASSQRTHFFFTPQLQYALEEGVKIHYDSEILSTAIGANRQISCEVNTSGDRWVITADQIFLSGHVEADVQLLEKLGFKTLRGGVQIDKKTLQTNIPGVFAAGNIAQSGRYAVHGSASGRIVAESIHRYLTGIPPQPEWINVRMQHLTEDEKDLLGKDRHDISRLMDLILSPEFRSHNFEEFNQGLTTDAAIKEAARCLNCDCASKRECSLRIQSTLCDANPRAFRGDRPAFEKDDSHPDIVYESGKCIKCGRCIAIAEQHREKYGLTYIGRGFSVKVQTPIMGKIAEGLSLVAIDCAKACPTGALSRKR